ncbi:hypothetical protein P8452_67849 [Trifolium repens]|nr:hypothetical protein P8452_67849 [Trifolium repens]
MATNFYSRLFLVICATVLLMMITSSPTVEAGGLDLGMEWIHQTKTTSTCEGSIADCMLQQGEEEFQLDNEINRRILANTKYISYGALQRNTVPCSRRGASYYNCKPGAQANPYSRGCSAITRIGNGNGNGFDALKLYTVFTLFCILIVRSEINV